MENKNFLPEHLITWADIFKAAGSLALDFIKNPLRQAPPKDPFFEAIKADWQEWDG